MSLRRHLLLAATTAVLGLAGCSKPAPAPAENNQSDIASNAVIEPANEATPAAAPAENAPDTLSDVSYVGRWKGVEGMVLDVKAKPGGGVSIANQWDLDHKGEFAGKAAADGLSWLRNGEIVIARPSNGDATGLKYLAGKKDCLTVKPGEGYCRD